MRAPGRSAESGDRIASGRVSPGRAGRSKSRKAASRSARLWEEAKNPRAMQQGNGAGGGKPMGMMNNDADGNNRWKTWQSDADIPSRKILIQHMYVPRSRRYRTRTNPNAARWQPRGSFFTRIAISRVARSTSVPANGSYRANVDPKSPRIRAACGCFSRGNPPRRRSGNRSSPTSCCAWKRRCTAAPAPRCATFVSFPFARRFFPR